MRTIKERKQFKNILMMMRRKMKERGRTIQMTKTQTKETIEENIKERNKLENMKSLMRMKRKKKRESI